MSEEVSEEMRGLVVVWVEGGCNIAGCVFGRWFGG